MLLLLKVVELLLVVVVVLLLLLLELLLLLLLLLLLVLEAPVAVGLDLAMGRGRRGRGRKWRGGQWRRGGRGVALLALVWFLVSLPSPEGRIPFGAVRTQMALHVRLRTR